MSGNQKKKNMIPISNEPKILLSNSEIKYVKTPEDRLHLAFNDSIRENKRVSGIINCLTVFLAFLVPCLTTTFNDYPIISGEAIKGIFIGILIASGVALAYNIIYSIIHHKDYSFNNFVKRVADKTEIITDDTNNDNLSNG